MLDPLRNPAPVPGAEPLGSLLPGTSPSSAPKTPAGASDLGGELPEGWFAREVERVRDQDRGEILSEARQGELSEDRRLARREGFDGTDQDEPLEPASLPAADVPAGPPVPTRPGVATPESGPPVGVQVPGETQAPPPLEPERPAPASAATGEAATREPGPAIAPQSAAPSPLAGVPTDAQASLRSAQAPTSVTRVEAPAQVFANAARGGRASGLPGQAAPAKPMTDSALLERAEEVLRQIKLKVGPGARQITIDLQPAELGRLTAHFALRQGKVAARVRVERPETLELLERQLPELKSALSQGGVQVESVELELASGQGSTADPGDDGPRDFRAALEARAPAPTTTDPGVNASGSESRTPLPAADTAVDFLA